MKIKPNRRAGLLRKPYHIALGCLPGPCGGEESDEGPEGTEDPDGDAHGQGILESGGSGAPTGPTAATLVRGIRKY